MQEITRKSERDFGPETSSFGVICLHSGPVIAGVLLGERSFHDFGDTVNTAIGWRVQVREFSTRLFRSDCCSSRFRG
jgi:hypothetical protein